MLICSLDNHEFIICNVLINVFDLYSSTIHLVGGCALQETILILFNFIFLL